jgi:hypothetical protein
MHRLEGPRCALFLVRTELRLACVASGYFHCRAMRFAIPSRQAKRDRSPVQWFFAASRFSGGM